mmetsp:Transcript_69486/g.192290  ORF Transcript_69486/g.192290 Transcript_69486/m.192290 type:complete len:217 (-) Transcript_69486:455-1105(-)
MHVVAHGAFAANLVAIYLEEHIPWLDFASQGTVRRDIRDLDASLVCAHAQVLPQRVVLQRPVVEAELWQAWPGPAAQKGVQEVEHHQRRDDVPDVLCARHPRGGHAYHPARVRGEGRAARVPGVDGSVYLDDEHIVGEDTLQQRVHVALRVHARDHTLGHTDGGAALREAHDLDLRVKFWQVLLKVRGGHARQDRWPALHGEQRQVDVMRDADQLG